MSKPSVYSPSPFGSRPASPPLGTPIDKDEDKQALMMGDMGGSRDRNSLGPHAHAAGKGGAGARPEEIGLKEQAGPILAYCGASIMMTVVNKVCVCG
jgi:GDP-mannose transporter